MPLIFPLNMTCSFPSAGADEHPVSTQPKAKTAAVRAASKTVSLRMVWFIVVGFSIGAKKYKREA